MIHISKGEMEILCWKYVGSFSKLNQFHISQNVSIYVYFGGYILCGMKAFSLAWNIKSYFLIEIEKKKCSAGCAIRLK